MIRSEVPVSSIDFDFSDRQDRSDDDFSAIQTEVRLHSMTFNVLIKDISFALSIELGQQLILIEDPDNINSQCNKCSDKSVVSLTSLAFRII